MFIRRYLLILLSLSAINVLQGCGLRLWTAREANPVLEDYLGTWPGRELGTLATRAGHRVNMTRMADGLTVDDKNWQRGEFCMEPPPDAMETVAAAFTAQALVKGSATDPRTNVKSEGETQAEFARSMATAMAPLLRRSQGLQWSRDNLSFLCGSYMNRRITSADFKKYYESVVEKSFSLIKEELQYLPKLPAEGSGTVNTPTIPDTQKKPNPTKSDASKPAGSAKPPAPATNSLFPSSDDIRIDQLGVRSDKTERTEQAPEQSMFSGAKSFFRRFWDWGK